MTGPTLLSLVLVVAVWAIPSHRVLAQPTPRDCANCGLGAGANQCGATDEDGLGYAGVFAARGPSRPRVTADPTVIAKLNAKLDAAKRQRSQAQLAGEPKGTTGAGDDVQGEPKTRCRHQQGSVVYVGKKPLTRPAPLPSSLKNGPGDAQASAARTQAELDRLLNLPSGSQIVPIFKPQGDLCYPSEQVRAAEIVQNPELVVTGVQPARVPKLPCGCDVVAPKPRPPSEFELAVAKETERRLAAIQAGESSLGFKSQQPGSAQPGFTPFSQSSVLLTDEFDNPEDDGLSFDEQESMRNAYEVRSQLPVDRVSLAIYYKQLAALHSQPKRKSATTGTTIAQIDEDSPFFGPKTEPRDGREQPKTVDSVPEEKMFNIPGPILELGPITVPEAQEPEAEPVQPLVTYSDIGFKPVAPSGNKFKTVPSKPASFFSQPARGSSPAGPGTQQPAEDDEIPCGPMGPPLPDYEPGKVLVTTRDQLEPDCEAGEVAPYRQGYNRNWRSGGKRKSTKAIKNGNFRTYASANSDDVDSEEEEVTEVVQDSNESVDAIQENSTEESEESDDAPVDIEEESPEVETVVRKRTHKSENSRTAKRPRLTVGCRCQKWNQ